ncbi:MAG: hypothetical protein GY743_17045, partial [Planctomycetaceae bacterium]|nr:hypothetical protein [Planctomycetaceae bacterium]
MASRTRGTTRFRALILLLLAALIGITAVNAAAGHPYPPVQEEANAEAPAAAAPEPAEVLGWDKQIDQKFKPVADWFLSVVFYPANLFGMDIPIVVIVLVIGATFFTLFFGLINIRLFPLAIGIVSGRYDAVDEDDDAEAI